MVVEEAEEQIMVQPEEILLGLTPVEQEEIIDQEPAVAQEQQLRIRMFRVPEQTGEGVVAHKKIQSIELEEMVHLNLYGHKPSVGKLPDPDLVLEEVPIMDLVVVRMLEPEEFLVMGPEVEEVLGQTRLTGYAVVIQ